MDVLTHALLGAACAHALVFIPVGALVATLFLWPLLRRRLPFRRVYLYALLGYSLAGVLDACTSYGTHLLWPFSADRVAWSVISIVDPLFTLVLAAAVGGAFARGRSWSARCGLAVAAFYLLAGAVQQQRAEVLAHELAAARGHAPESLLVKPTIGNLLLWRSTYVADGRVHADGVRPGLLGPPRVYVGESAVLFDLERDLSWAPPGSRAHHDAARFVALSDGIVARHPRRPELIGDVRYGMLPTDIAPLWGIVLDPASADAPAAFVTDRTLSAEARERFVAMLLGRAAGR
jgi:inner membrane protein